MIETYKGTIVFAPNPDNPTEYGTVSLLIEVPQEYPGAEWDAKFERFQFSGWYKPEHPIVLFTMGMRKGQPIEIGWDPLRGDKKKAFYIPAMDAPIGQGNVSAPANRGSPPPSRPSQGRAELNSSEWAQALQIMAAPIVAAIQVIMDAGMSEDVATRIALTCAITLDKRHDLILAAPKPKPSSPPAIDMEEVIANSATAVSHTKMEKMNEFFEAIVKNDQVGYFSGAGDSEQTRMAHAAELLRSAGYSSDDIGFDDTSSLYRVARVAYSMAYDILYGATVQVAAENHTRPKGEEWEPLF